MTVRPGRADGAEHHPPDLRAVLLAAVCWTGALAAFLLPRWGALLLLGCGASWALLRHRLGRPVVLLCACLAVGGAVAVVAMLRIEANARSPVAALAGEDAVVEVTASVTSDPVVREGRFGAYVLVRATVVEVTGRGRTYATHVPVLVIGDETWAGAELGSRLRFGGRLSTADGPDLAGVLTTHRAPTVLREPGWAFDAAAAVRAGIRASVAPLGPEERSLVPALVVGDDTRMPEQLVEDFRTSGLTHLSAVSGTNLTLVVGFLLLVARWAGVRARGLLVVGSLGVAGFVLLARTEPSVVRAAAMGSVALLGMGSNGRQKGVRALGVAVVVLLLFDPWLALSAGFALSVLATAGILFLAPSWRDALSAWLPRWAAEAVAVPFAAQLACTPVVAALSGQVSLVAVLANMLVAAAVAPATVLGLVGGLLTLAVPRLGLWCGHLAGWCAWWIVTVAEHAAALPAAALDWSADRLSVAVLTLICLAVAVLAPRLLVRRWRSAGCALVLVAVMVRPLPSIGWPPPGWVLVACDVGQGDGLVLHAGPGSAVVVDAGPDPTVMGRCLDRLRVQRVPVLVLTHFHADHVDGIDGVLAGREVGEVDVTATREPEYGAELVDERAAAAHVPVRVPALGEVRRAGDLTWQVIGPVGRGAAVSHGEEGSVANNASLVLLVRVHGIRILMGGDMEPEAQEALAAAAPSLQADVLKVPHHGSRYQDPALLGGLGARLAVVSVGADNDYGHPAGSTLRLLRRAGMLVRRTDQSGAVAVVVHDGRLGVVTRG